MTSGPDSDYIEHSTSRPPHVRHESGDSPYNSLPPQNSTRPSNHPRAPLPTCEVSKRHDSSTVNRHRRSVAIIGPCKLRPCGDGEAKRDPASSLGHARFLDDN